MTSNSTSAGRAIDFLYLHCEKLVFSLVGVLALTIVYASLTLPRLDDELQADALHREVIRTRNEIESFTWDKAVSNHSEKICKAKVIKPNNSFRIDIQAYASASKGGELFTGFDVAVIAPMIARADPVILNALDVRAIGGTGMLAFADEDIRRQRQLSAATEAAELAKSEYEKVNTELYKQQPGQIRKRGGRVNADPSNQPYDADHPKRRPIDASLRSMGVALQGDERIERAYWACVVAKVPIREQFELYQDVFENARGYDVGRDFPQYLGFFVERAEVLPGSELEWSRVPLYDGQQKSIASNTPLSIGPNHAIGMKTVEKLYKTAAQFWAGGGSSEVVDERFLERTLTLPLPPLVGREWGTDATHPDIRHFLSLSDGEAEQVVASSSELPLNTTASEFGSWKSSTPGSPRPYGTGLSGYGPSPTRQGGMGRDGYYTGSRSLAQDPTIASGSSRIRTPSSSVDYHLLRFFDFTVKPGKKYKYRVKLAIADPNYNMPANSLAPTVLDRLEVAAKANRGRSPTFRLAEAWSDPSPIVGIPISGRIRLAGVRTPSGDKYFEEPSVGLLIEAFALDDKGNAIQAGTEEKECRRGYVANLIKDTAYVGPGYIDTLDNFQFLTGVTLLDVGGGAKLTREMSTPGRILLMGPAGQLYIRDEVEDKPFVEHHRLLFEKSNPNNRRASGRIATRPA